MNTSRLSLTMFLVIILMGLSSLAEVDSFTEEGASRGAQDQTPEPEPEPEGEWRQLFNGKDLTGWKVKMSSHELGDNFGNTFRVEDGLLKVAYD